MSIDELCALPVETLAEKDCLLFLWATFPQFPEALRLIRAWGFTFKTVAFVWLKLNKKSPTWFYGLGYWTRGNAEICLLAKRGKPKPAGLNPAAIVLLLALLGGGGVFAYLKLVKNKPKTKGNDSLDDYDYGEEDSEEWETEDEESEEPDADGGSTEEDDEDSVK